MTRPLRLAALAWPVGREDGFAAKLDHWCETARRERADLLLLPEYAPCEGAFARGGGSAMAERDAAADEADRLVAEMAAAAARHGLWIAGGTVLRRNDAGGIVNACPLVSPAGVAGFQEKRTRTGFERASWTLVPGGWPAVFDTPWGRLGIAVCYDVEFPPLVRAQVEAGAWAVLVPASTDTPNGATRVTVSARARAIENQVFVAVAPTVGAMAGCESLDANTGRAGIYGPADRGFAEDGIIAEAATDAPGLVLATLDPAGLEAVRREGAVLNHADWPPVPVPPCPVIHSPDRSA
ncbi:nitrilase-related carbon-nitrogen hydrolase [Elioraea rosea]|uniref:nitrilase-related carbon-nitrogen hydrolase n=1 Tax=Elioraea rosea TaxID=2492390 RepID=UPI0011846777|nr:nitrilase-related carbon-nitrogen hydrolase [Elioraea rosea]